MTNTTNDRNTGQKIGDQAHHALDEARDMGNRAAEQARNLGREAWEAGQHPQPEPREEHREGRIARTIEQQTAKLPSDAFLWAAFGAIGASVILQVAGKEEKANFVGQWAPTLLIFGLYNKMVKLLGSDAR